MRRKTTLKTLLAAALALLALWAMAASAQALTLVPPRKTVFFGVSDRGTTDEFYEFEEMVGKHPALLETFHPWGNSLNRALERWRETAVRPVLHISTFDDQTLAELITPQQIALGSSDNYLLQVNHVFSKNGLRAYIRPLGEPNRCLNPYSAVDCDGKQKGGEHSTTWYKQAFRRIVAIVRGGTLEEIDERLASVSLPPLNRQGKPNPKAIPEAPVAFIWSPLPAGAPRVKGNWPGNYWPGSRWVDWVGTDFYSQYPHWRDLSRFFRRPLWRKKPFALTEVAVAGEDDPRFIRRLIAWTVRRPKVRMLLYYRGFGEDGNEYRLGLYPRSANTLRRKIRRPSFWTYAPGHAASLPPAE